MQLWQADLELGPQIRNEKLRIQAVARAPCRRLDEPPRAIDRDLDPVMFLENDAPERIVGVSVPNGGRVVASCT